MKHSYELQEVALYWPFTQSYHKEIVPHFSIQENV